MRRAPCPRLRCGARVAQSRGEHPRSRSRGAALRRASRLLGKAGSGREASRSRRTARGWRQALCEQASVRGRRRSWPADTVRTDVARIQLVTAALVVALVEFRGVPAAKYGSVRERIAKCVMFAHENHIAPRRRPLARWRRREEVITCPATRRRPLRPRTGPRPTCRATWTRTRCCASTVWTSRSRGERMRDARTGIGGGKRGTDCSK